MGGGAQGTGSDEKWFAEAYAHFQYVQSSLTRESVIPNLLRAPQSPLCYELAAQAIYSIHG